MRASAVWLWATLVFLVSLLPPGMVGQPPAWLRGIPALDKLVHAALYGVLALLEMWARGRPASRRLARLALWRVTLLCLAFGGVLESLQGLVGYRSADVLDALANGLGALIGAFIAAVAWRMDTARSLARGSGGRRAAVGRSLPTTPVTGTGARG